LDAQIFLDNFLVIKEVSWVGPLFINLFAPFWHKPVAFLPIFNMGWAPFDFRNHRNKRGFYPSSRVGISFAEKQLERERFRKTTF
jgi:hypothetical protein